jgi:hypothetical protein
VGVEEGGTQWRQINTIKEKRGDNIRPEGGESLRIKIKKNKRTFNRQGTVPFST